VFRLNTACDLPKVDLGRASGAGLRLSLFSDVTWRRLVFGTDVSGQLIRAICRKKQHVLRKIVASFSWFGGEKRKHNSDRSSCVLHAKRITGTILLTTQNFVLTFTFDKISNKGLSLAGHGDRGGLTDLNPPKIWHLSTKLHGVIPHKTVIHTSAILDLVNVRSVIRILGRVQKICVSCSTQPVFENIQFGLCS